MSDRLAVTILHELPGRLRAQLSHALGDEEGFARTLRSHEGIEPVRYAPATRTILVRYDPLRIRREELLVRTALALSLEQDARPVRIEPAPPGPQLSGSVGLSALTLLAGGIARLLRIGPANLRRLDRLAGTATGAAVVSHAAHEVRQQGAYHPEVVSVAYLAVGMLRGNAWPAAVLTWFASFGRHLLETEASAIEVRPAEGDAHEVVASTVPARGWQAGLRFVPVLMGVLGGAGRAGGADLLTNLREVSNLHDQVLDALGPWKEGIPLRVDSPGSPQRTQATP